MLADRVLTAAGAHPVHCPAVPSPLADASCCPWGHCSAKKIVQAMPVLLTFSCLLAPAHPLQL